MIKLNPLESKIFRIVAANPGTNIWEHLPNNVHHKKRDAAKVGLLQKGLIHLYGTASRTEIFKLSPLGCKEYCKRITEPGLSYDKIESGHYVVRHEPYPVYLGIVKRLKNGWSFKVQDEDKWLGEYETRGGAAMQLVDAYVASLR